ncbi:MAG: heparinase II/III family protein [Calditrichia bacterium]
MLLMKYGVQGDGHGHFDKLQFIFYDQHREVVPDYGFSRWINMEPKYGGRYTKENDSFAKQTIAHNTVVVDEKTQHNFSRREADDRWANATF